MSRCWAPSCSVPFEPDSLLVARSDDAPPRRSQIRELGQPLSVQSLVLEAEVYGRGQLSDALRSVEYAAPVNDHGNLRTAVGESGACPAAREGRDVDLTSLGVDVAPTAVYGVGDDEVRGHRAGTRSPRAAWPGWVALPRSTTSRARARYECRAWTNPAGTAAARRTRVFGRRPSARLTTAAR